MLLWSITWGSIGWFPIAEQSLSQTPPAEYLEPPATTDERTLSAPLLDWSHAQQAHRLIERWVKLGQVESINERAILVSGLFGLRVTLRTGGYTVGTGNVILAQAAPNKQEPMNLTNSAAQATNSALAELRERLTDARSNAKQRALLLGNKVDIDKPSLADIAPQLSVDVQLAHRLKRILIPRNAPVEAILAYFAPGFHGLRLAIEDSKSAYRWPATALASNISRKSQLIGLMSDLGYPPDDLNLIGRPDGPQFDRFEVIHIVRPRLELPAIQLIRGNVLLPLHSINSGTLDDMANRLGAHLHHRFTLQGEARGTYHPTTDRYEPAIATGEEIALASYAMIRHLGHLHQLQHRNQDLVDRAENILYAVTQCANYSLNEEHAISPETMAWCVLTFSDSFIPLDNPARAMCDRLGDNLVALWDRENGFRNSMDENASPVNEATAALITAALAARFDQTREFKTGIVVTQAMEMLWQHSNRNPTAAALPWLMVAHHRAAHLLAGEDPQAKIKLASREQAIASLVELLCEQQIISKAKIGPDDVRGGFNLDKSTPGSALNPDWRSTQLLGFLANCMKVEGVTLNHDTFRWALSAGLAARFIAQLMIDDPSCFYMKNPSEALGGVRQVLWDNRLPIAPTALSLLAVTELQQTLLNFPMPY